MIVAAGAELTPSQKERVKPKRRVSWRAGEGLRELLGVDQQVLPAALSVPQRSP